MIDNLLPSIENKVMTILAELRCLRSELQQLKQENAILRADQGNHVEKLQHLVSLLNDLDIDSAKHTNEIFEV
jgi:regulator of replication initiation timing